MTDDQTLSPATRERREKVAAWVSRLGAELPDGTPAAAYATPGATRTRKLSTVVKECGFKAGTQELLTDIDNALAASGIHSHRPLASRALKNDDWVKFSRLPFPPDELFFSNERLLTEYLLAGIGHFGPFKDLELLGQEYRLPSGRFIDLLCRERRKDGKGQLVAIELKKGDNSTGVVTQIRKYLDELATLEQAQGRPVRGIIVSGRADDAEAENLSASNKHEISWYTYAVTLERKAGH